MQIIQTIYNSCAFEISHFKLEQESKKYDACRFKLNGLNIISRSAQITPKKIGQFVTCWKRIDKEPIKPFEEKDLFDFYVVNVQTENNIGQFVFPKSVLIEKGIVSTDKKEGKRAFRVYPNWDIPENKQAKRSQKWQLNYFYEINNSTNFKNVAEFYKP